MPEVRFVRVPQGRTIGDAVMAAREACLPDEIRQNAVAQWVLQHDRTMEPSPPDGDRPPPERDSPHELQKYVLKRAAFAIFQRRIPMYFGALLHIGRVWEVSARALREIALLNEPSVLADAAREIGDSIPEDSSRGPAEDDVRTELEHACSDARQLHTGRVQQARDWWRLWRNEVSPFRDQKERLDAAFHASSGRRERGWEFASVVLDTVLLGSEPSTLVSDLRRDGAEFRGGDFHADSIGSLGGIAAWLPLVFWRDPEFHWWSRHFVEHWIHLQEVRVRQERERLLAPCVEAALAALRAQGGDAGPFLPYDVGGRPPSPELAAAYRQHLLPDGTASPWRMQWEARLDALPRGQALPHNWRAALDELTRQADATVRLGACTDAPRLGEPWPAYLQRVFEEKYVAVAAIGIAKPRRPDDALSVPAYAAFLAALTEKLVGMGYELTPPTAQRVDRLFVAVRKTGYASSGDW